MSVRKKKLKYGEIFSESYYINLKSDFIYHFPIDIEPDGLPYDLISVWFYKISKTFLCEYTQNSQKSSSVCAWRLKKSARMVFENRNKAYRLTLHTDGTNAAKNQSIYILVIEILSKIFSQG